MKILKLMALAVVAGLLSVSSANAATALVAGSNFTDGQTFTGNGAVVNDVYDFSLTGDLLTNTFINFSTNDSTFADLTFTWSHGGTDVASLVLTDATGGEVGSTPFVATLLAVNTPYTLTVTGTVYDPNELDLPTSYDFTIVPTAVPLPAAFWLFGSALVGFISFGRRKAA